MLLFQGNFLVLQRSWHDHGAKSKRKNDIASEERYESSFARAHMLKHDCGRVCIGFRVQEFVQASKDVFESDLLKDTYRIVHNMTRLYRYLSALEEVQFCKKKE